MQGKSMEPTKAAMEIFVNFHRGSPINCKLPMTYKVAMFIITATVNEIIIFFTDNM